ncbi:ABC transporter permease [Phytohabitans sp. ZYX-F-186]|uniref:ABC transporter permease n=1 Tax=Phytohabitans maris TaxID=3071409 RepID=A0ABU0Z9E0_9ACTN|nr:ABC transporter permease [Phytohabitans sp. ZYX-F-186]MDQ7903644.1 ABC transporter permease [Phytohabitans sp. ZYX-F-186]
MIWRLVRRELAMRSRRAALTGVGAVVGVGLICGTLVLLETVAATAGADEDVRQLGQLVLVAGVVAVLVGAVLINAAFTVTVAQRTRELALLRCLGADGGQLRRLVGLEALVIGGLAGLVGLGAGVGVAAGLRAYVNSDLFPSGDLSGSGLVVSARTAVVSLLVGCGVTVLSALAPARRAGRTAPLAALRATPGSVRRAGQVRLVVGGVAVVLGVAAVPFAAVAGPGVLLLPAGVLTLLGLRLVGARVAGPLARLVGIPVARTLRLPGALAQANTARNPERTAATASALAIGLALVSFVLVLSASTKAAIEDEGARTPELHVRYEPRAGERAGIGADVVDRLAGLPELAAVAPLRSGEATVAGRPDRVTAVDPERYRRAQPLKVVAGSVTDLAAGGLGVTERVAATRGWTVGTPVPVRLPGGERTLTVRVVYAGNSYLPGAGDYLMAQADYAALGGDPTVRDVPMAARDGVPAGAVRAAVARVLAVDPALTVEDRGQARQRYLGQINRSTSLFLALAGLAGVVGLLGILTTTALSIVDRARELGMLRAVGMARHQIRLMIRGEALIVALLGVLGGGGLGLLFGWGAARVLAGSSSPTRFTVPTAALAAVAAAAAVAGVLAAALPARAASRIEVLGAIATE